MEAHACHEVITKYTFKGKFGKSEGKFTIAYSRTCVWSDPNGKTDARKKTHLVLWRPGAVIPPRLVIGQLDASSVLIDVRTLDMDSSPVSTSYPGATSGRLEFTDRAAYCVDWRQRGGAGQAPLVVVANFSDWGTDVSVPNAEYKVNNWPDAAPGSSWQEITQNRPVSLVRTGRFH
jgi:hypothetical protein